MSDAQESTHLIETITEALLGDQGQYREIVAGKDPGRVELVRRCGRTAGRRGGLKVRTLAHRLADGRHEVLVVNLQSIDPGDELGQLRWQRRLRAAVQAAAEQGPTSL